MQLGLPYESLGLQWYSLGVGALTVAYGRTVHWSGVSAVKKFVAAASAGGPVAVERWLDGVRLAAEVRGFVGV